MPLRYKCVSYSYKTILTKYISSFSQSYSPIVFTIGNCGSIQITSCVTVYYKLVVRTSRVLTTLTEPLLWEGKSYFGISIYGRFRICKVYKKVLF